MSLIDRLKDGTERILPRSSHLSTSISGGIGSGHGMVPFDDDVWSSGYIFWLCICFAHDVFLMAQVIVSKSTILLHSSQIFFSFLAMACFSSVASFQAKWGVGPCIIHRLLSLSHRSFINL